MVQPTIGALQMGLFCTEIIGPFAPTLCLNLTNCEMGIFDLSLVHRGIKKYKDVSVILQKKLHK